MRQYRMREMKEKETVKIICNMCGKEIEIANGIAKEDVLSVEKRWGYPSDKDNEVHRFDLCEECYDNWIRSFVVAVEKE